MAGKLWKKGRGKLGLFAPLLGTWVAQASSPQGKVTCARTFASVLGSKYIRLTALWTFGKTSYEEVCYFGADGGGMLRFWSFTNDGKQSTGEIADVTDVHPEAIGFEAQMPAGLARQVYWPDPAGGFHWAVEARNKKGWKRFVEHHYQKQGS
jgi:hypothetical protein